MSQTWYVLEDGTYADPTDVVTVEGRLQHADGRPVRMRSADVPLTRSMSAAEIDAVTPAVDEPRQTYKTRQSKARG